MGLGFKPHLTPNVTLKQVVQEKLHHITQFDKNFTKTLPRVKMMVNSNATDVLSPFPLVSLIKAGHFLSLSPGAGQQWSHPTLHMCERCPWAGPSVSHTYPSHVSRGSLGTVATFTAHSLSSWAWPASISGQQRWNPPYRARNSCGKLHRP